MFYCDGWRSGALSVAVQGAFDDAALRVAALPGLRGASAVPSVFRDALWVLSPGAPLGRGGLKVQSCCRRPRLTLPAVGGGACRSGLVDLSGSGVR